MQTTGKEALTLRSRERAAIGRASVQLCTKAIKKETTESPPTRHSSDYHKVSKTEHQLKNRSFPATLLL